MTHTTIDGNFKTSEQAIEDVLNNQVAKKNPIDGFHPVCVKIQVSPRVVRYGMQFWPLETIKKGECQNSDGTKSILC